MTLTEHINQIAGPDNMVNVTQDMLNAALSEALHDYSAVNPRNELGDVVISAGETALYSPLPTTWEPEFSAFISVETPIDVVSIDDLPSVTPVASGSIKIQANNQTIIEDATVLNFKGDFYVSDSGEGTASIQTPAPSFAIQSFTHNADSNLEIGHLITTLTFDWAYSEPVTAQAIDSMDIDVELRTYTLTGQNITSNTTFTLSATSEFGAKMDTTSVTFKKRNYYGRGAVTIDASDIIGLDSALDTNTSGTYSFLDAGNPVPSEEAYLWICVPASYATLNGSTDFVNPATTFNVPMNLEITVSVTNAHGHTENYKCYRSVNAVAESLNVRV